MLKDTWVVFARLAVLAVRSPVLIGIGLLQPLAYLFLYAPMLETALKPTGTDAYRVFVPGLLVILAVSGGLFQGYWLLAEVRAGVVERTRVTPASGISLLLGRALIPVAGTVVQSAFVIAVSALVGMTTRIESLVLAFLTLGTLALMTTCMSYLVVLIAGSEDYLSPAINILMQPLIFLSGIMLPLAYAPSWLRGVAMLNPFARIVDGMRALFAGSPSTPVVWQSIIIATVLAIGFLAWAARAFARVVR